MVYILCRQNQMTLSALADSRRAILYAAVAGIALLVAAQDELLDWAGGFIIWIGLAAAAPSDVRGLARSEHVCLASRSARHPCAARA